MYKQCSDIRMDQWSSASHKRRTSAVVLLVSIWSMLILPVEEAYTNKLAQTTFQASQNENHASYNYFFIILKMFLVLSVLQNGK